MSNRRMFSNRIANSAKFLQMPAESQLLYFHMVLRADDDGVVEAYPINKLLGLASDNFKILLTKGFIKELNEDQVVIIIDWLEHNTIRADRKTNSIYKYLLPPEIKVIEPKPRSDVEDNSKRVGGQSTGGISKVKLSKVNIPVITGNTSLKEKRGITTESGNTTENKTRLNVVYDLMEWAEKRRGRKFTNTGKQLKAIKMMRGKVKLFEIKKRWAEMEEDKWWKEKGFDFKNLADSFDRQ